MSTPYVADWCEGCSPDNCTGCVKQVPEGYSILITGFKTAEQADEYSNRLPNIVYEKYDKWQANQIQLELEMK